MKDWGFRFLQTISHFVSAESGDQNEDTGSTERGLKQSKSFLSPAATQHLIQQSEDRPQETYGDKIHLSLSLILIILGSHQVDDALHILQKFERQNPRLVKKRSALIGAIGQYLRALLPQVIIHGSQEGVLYDSPKIPGHLDDAVKLLEEAAELKNPDAIYLLAQMNFYGNFSYPRNYSEAFKRYHQLALLHGNSSAQHMLGFMYATGIGGAHQPDQAKSLLYHTFATYGGNKRSEMSLAFRYHAGIGVVADCNVAVEHYRNVARKGIEWFRSGPPGGMIWVSDSYRLADEIGGVYGEGASYSSSGENKNKHGVHSDAYAALDDVLEYLDLMSRKGDFKATFSLGRIHYYGQKGLPRNLKSAKWYFMRVAKLYWQRDGRIIESDKPGLEKVATKAAGYIGRMFLRGEGVEQSYEKAQVWFLRGIKSGDAGSQWGMGLMLLEGLGVSKNPIRATEYFKAAADQDYAPAQVSLGTLYLDQGTSNDIQVASRYFELATRYGHIEAFYFLAELMEKGIGRDRNCGLAAAYYKSVAEKVEPFLSSFTEANAAYDNGHVELALIDYLHAAEQGWEKAQANVAYLLDEQRSLLKLPSWLSFTTPRPEVMKNGALALTHWTRSARQSNIDSLVKMGDYYLKGIGTPANMEKAASCYAAACEYHKSAMAYYNLAWMHENGAGLDQDFHLAKRYYDLALETNEEAYLPVTLSLLKLRIRSAWNTLTNGRINSIQNESREKQWSLSEWISNFLRDEKKFDSRSYDEDTPQKETIPSGDSDGLYDDAIQDGIFESLIILSLCAALVFLIWYRQQRQQAHRRDPDAGIVGAQLPGAAAAQQQRGVFPQPGEPEFAQWVAGGVGH
ncbi:ubiquitin-protein ligase Sel1/Ubx2 [Blumeria hordei DH14]|uniref:Ubiquitin-protein ligase Sel1/Ubx2 n=1 Tax=Blumeria graminis f. sp. hordei (strain DH14) TaxID=546991 RepID=N1JLR7_BLUG1|nr:ubiquitin-protein ligase Sel1/Ubx2 [Blumeria hordei DH14]